MTTQYWITGTAGDWSDAADWVSGVVPSSTDGAVINATGGVTVNGTAVAYSLALDGQSYLTVSGTLTLDTSLTVDDSSTLGLSGGTLSAQSISSNDEGYFRGYGTISGVVSGDFQIYANGGTLTVKGSLAGDQGSFFIDQGATLELSNGPPVGAPIYFKGSPATLKLDAPTTFTGAIEDIVVGDAIDLVGITASSASYSGTTLTINETNGHQLIYNNVSGSLAGDTVMVASDSHVGTLVYWINGPPPVPTVVADNAHVSAAGTVTANAAHGVLANDTDPIPNDTLVVSAVDGLASDVGHATAGNYGTLTLNADGSYSYVADHSVPTNIIAQDVFTYTATDGDEGSATSSLTITITQPGQTYIAGTPGQALTSGNGSVFLDGSQLQNETISAGNGVDAVIAGSNDTIKLGNGNDVVQAGDGDTITLGNGIDTVTAGANSTITLGNGSDTVSAGNGSSITLGNGSDTVIAGTNNIIKLGNGPDTVYAAKGDTITVGNGHDTFFFGQSPGQTTAGMIGPATINHFSAANDVIEIASSLAGVWNTTSAGLSSHIQTVSGNAVITLDTSGDTITLVGVQASALHASNFHFG